MVFNMTRSSVCTGNETMPIAVVLRRFTGYKYSFCQALPSISHYFTFFLRVFSHSLHLLTMEDKRGTKRSRSFASGSSYLSSDTSTSSSSPSESLSPLVSPPDMSSRMPPPLIREHGRPSEEILVVDLSSGVENDFPDNSQDEEFARRLFKDLNRGLLGLPSDDNIIILNDSDEE
jgi:hypothetical protein